MTRSRYGVIAAAKHVATAVQEQVVSKSIFASSKFSSKPFFRQSIGTGKSPISLASACIYLVGQLSEQASRRSFGEPAQKADIVLRASARQSLGTQANEFGLRLPLGGVWCCGMGWGVLLG